MKDIAIFIHGRIHRLQHGFGAVAEDARGGVRIFVHSAPQLIRKVQRAVQLHQHPGHHPVIGDWVRNRH